MNDNDTTHVRIRKATLLRLKQEADQLLAVHAEGKHHQELDIDLERINPAGSGLSMNELINHLLDFKERWRKRRKESRDRKKGKGKRE